MDWSKGFVARYFASIVDPQSWRDTSTFNISGGSVKLTDNGLRESADIQCEPVDLEGEHWIRIYLDARNPNGESALVPIFTGLSNATNKEYDGRNKTYSLVCYSVLKPAEDMLLPLGWNIMGGYNGARAVKELLEEVTPAPIRIEGDSPHTTQAIVAESGESNLSMIDYILTSIGWRLRIDGSGAITICEYGNDAISTYGINNDVIEMEVSVKNDWYDCPNVFRAINDNIMAIARDEDPNSIFSIPSRGREIWMEDSSVTLNSDETLGQYARRRLQEEQSVMYSLNYERRFDPNVRATDLIWITYPEQEIDGAFEVTSQTIELNFGARVSEEAANV